MKEARTIRSQAEWYCKRLSGWFYGDERRGLVLPRRKGRRGQPTGKSSLVSPCSSDERGSSQTSDASRQGGSVDTSAEGPPGGLWEPVSAPALPPSSQAA